MGKIRWNSDDQKLADLNSIQVTYKKLARLLCNVTLKDRNSTNSLFDKLGLFSYNQANAQVKLTEAWKMERGKDYSIKFEKKSEASCQKNESNI